MNKKDIGSIADAIEAIGATVSTIADGLEGDLGRSLLFLSVLLDQTADDLRRIEREGAGTP